jgi:transposase
MWYSGIDPHKAFCLITTYGPEGPAVKQARVASTAIALQHYYAQFPGPHQAVVESTGGWYWLADTLAALGVELVLAHATRVKAIAAAKVKTDKVDSNILALLLRADPIPRAHMIAPATTRRSGLSSRPRPGRNPSGSRARWCRWRSRASSTTCCPPGRSSTGDSRVAPSVVGNLRSGHAGQAHPPN